MPPMELDPATPASERPQTEPQTALFHCTYTLQFNTHRISAFGKHHISTAVHPNCSTLTDAETGSTCRTVCMLTLCQRSRTVSVQCAALCKTVS